MSNLNPTPECVEAVVADSDQGAPPLEAQERTEDRPAGPPFVPALASQLAPRQCRTRLITHLTLADRIKLEVAVRAGDTQAAVAGRLDRAPSTIIAALPGTGGALDQVTTATRHYFLPPPPEAFTHDLDGNPLTDGHGHSTWDAEPRLVTCITQDATVAAGEPPQKLTYYFRLRPSWPTTGWLTGVAG